jgi:hypothetical protein
VTPLRGWARLRSQAMKRFSLGGWPSHEGRDGRGRKPGENHSCTDQGVLMRATRTELLALLRRIAGELPNLPEGSPELRAAYANL